VKNRMGALLLVLLALFFVPAIGAAPPQQAKTKDADSGLSWAYGFPVPPGVPMPAHPPAGPRENVDALQHLPGAPAAFTSKQIDDGFDPADWYPGDHPKMPEIVSHGRKPDVRACGFCHYPNGKGRPNNAGPAGLPAAYIVQQLMDFKSGARASFDKRKTNTNLMVGIARGLTPEEMKSAAEYFSSVKWTPWVKVIETNTVPKTYFVGKGGSLRVLLKGADAGTEPIGEQIVEVPANVKLTDLRDPRSGFIAYVPEGSLERGKLLVTMGGPGKTIGCANCHGAGLKGGSYGEPELAGRSPSYLAQQLYDFKRFARNGPGAQLMRPVVQNLSGQDILDITAYVSSLAP
jgi:cytochrome c553